MDSDMAVLVPVAARVFDGCETQTVDARDLHAVLQLSSAFTDWLAYQIQSLELIENTDFFNFSEVSEKPGRPRLEYLLTLDCAKHIAMASRSERGRMVRQYFIEVEKRMRAMAKPLQAQMSANLPTDYLSALEALVEAEKAKRAQALEMEAQRKLLAEAQPKVEFFDAVADSKDAVPMGNVAKVLGVEGMGRNKLFAFLRGKKVLMRDNQPYQEFVDRGYFRVVEQKWSEPDGTVRVSFKTLVFQKGLDYIRRLLEKRCP